MARLHFIERKKNMKTKFLAGFVTVFVITLLILSGPASAITLGVDNFSSTTPDEDSEVSFLAKVDLHTNDRIPLTNVTVLIEYSNGTSIPTANLTFDLAGNILSPSGSPLEVQIVSSQENYSASAGYGYGYGYNFTDTTYHNTSFDYGYGFSAGYGYDDFSNDIKSSSEAISAEFVYNITWETPQVSANTTYKVKMQVYADDGDNIIRYEIKAPSVITVVNDDTTVASTSHGGGGSSTTYADESVLSSGDIYYLRVLDKIKFGIDSANHSLTLKQFNSTMATVKIQSEPITVYLSKGILQEFDVNDDSALDVKVRYDGIVGGKAAIFLQEIKQTAPTGETPSPGTGDAVNDGTTSDTTGGTTSTPGTTTEVKKTFGYIMKVIIIVLLAVAAVLIVVSLIFKRSRKDRY